MRRLVIAVLMSATLMGTAHATEYRYVLGVVATPTIVTPGGPNIELARCAHLNDLPKDSVGGSLGGVVVELLPGEDDGAHAFVLTDAQMGITPPPTNFDVTFVSSLGACGSGGVSPVEPAEPPVFARPGDESVIIPVGMRFAIVTATDGVDVPFELIIFN